MNDNSSKPEQQQGHRSAASGVAADGDGLTRRDFLRNSSATVAATAVVPAVLGGAASSAQEAVDTGTVLNLTVNGEARQVTVQDHWTLVELLRDHLGLTGTKIGCNRSECGACTVLVDGQPLYACSQLAVWLEGRRVTTVEGLAQGGQLSPLQQAFVDHNGAQCGFCTPGQLMSATALLAGTPSPDATQVKNALVGNICRCSNYNAIVEAVVDAGRRNGGAV